MGKTEFINRCLKQTVFPNDQSGDTDELEMRLRQAELVEAEFKACLTVIDVPYTGQIWDKNTSYPLHV